MYAYALVGALLLALALVVLQLFSGFDVPDYSLHKAAKINSVAQMTLVGALVAAWGFSVYFRCSDALIKKYLVAIAALFVLWLLDVIVKYAVHDDFLTSVFWYLFYVPLIFTPTLCLFSAIRAATLGRLRFVRILKPLLVVVDLLLLLFVFTNNIHYEVFSFSFDDPNWSDNYTYRWGYWLIFFWCVAQFAGFLATLFVAARRQLRSAFLPLLVIVAIGLVYGFLYAFRIGDFILSNFTLTFILLVTVALEACLSLGILPSYIRYSEAFRKLPFDVKILSQKFQMVFATDCAKPLSPEVKEAAESAWREKMGTAAFKVDGEPNTLYKMFPLVGGTVLLPTM